MSTPLVLSIVIPGEPFAQPRARSFPLMKKGPGGKKVPVLGAGGVPIVKHYDEKSAVSWKTSAQDRMVAALREAGLASPFVTTGPVRVEIDALFSCLKGDRKTRNPRPLRRKSTGKDLDNIEKAVLDAAKGVLWLDDAQVSEMSSRKLYAPQDHPPRVELRVWALAEDVEAAARHDLAALLHIAAMVSSRPCECSGLCDTCAPCLARQALGVKEPTTREVEITDEGAIRSLFDL